MTSGFVAINIMETIIGGQTTPLMTALQNRALMGSRWIRFKARPAAIMAESSQ
jgi:hypothetical protein